MELSDTVQAFLRDVTARDLSPKTYRRYHDDLADLCEFLRRHSIIRLEQVTSDQVRQYIADLHTRPNGRRPGTHLSPFTIEGMYRSLKTFFRFCEAEEYLFDNPMRRIRKPKLPDLSPPALSENQIALLLDELAHTQSHKRNLAVISLLIDPGLRRGEALGLTMDRLFLDERRIRVLGKGRKERDVPLCDATAAALSEYLLVRPPSSDPRVFLNLDGSPFQAAGLRSLFTRLQIRLGVPRLYPHLLRHTFASLFYQRTQDVKSLQTILGHAKASTTLDIYVKIDFNTVRQVHHAGSPLDHIYKVTK